MDTSALIDSNILIDHLRGKAEAIDLLKSLAYDGVELKCSVITHVELLAGMRRNEEKSTRQLLRLLEEIPVNVEIAELAGMYKNIFMKSHNLNLGDAIIAATAKKEGTTLYTLNTRHFPMDDIRVEAPY